MPFAPKPFLRAQVDALLDFEDRQAQEELGAQEEPCKYTTGDEARNASLFASLAEGAPKLPFEWEKRVREWRRGMRVERIERREGLGHGNYYSTEPSLPGELESGFGELTEVAAQRLKVLEQRRGSDKAFSFATAKRVVRELAKNPETCEPDELVGSLVEAEGRTPVRIDLLADLARRSARAAARTSVTRASRKRTALSRAASRAS